MPLRFLFIFALCLILHAAFSQPASRSAVTVSSGIERTVYWSAIIPYVDLGYNYSVGDFLILNAGLGFARSSPENITPYPIKQIIQNIEPNAHLFLSVLPAGYRYQLKIGGGIRQIFTHINYSPQILLKDGQVIGASRANYNVNKPAIDLVVQADYRINDRFFIGLHADGNFYTDKNSLQPLKIESTENFGPFTSTQGITAHPRSMLHGLIRIGYVF